MYNILSGVYRGQFLPSTDCRVLRRPSAELSNEY